MYTVPKLVSYEDLSKTWYVYFRYNGKVVKKTGEINRIHDHNKRLAAGEDLAIFWRKKLYNGWEPPKFKIPKSSSMSFSNALDFAMEKKVISPKTRQDYNCTVRYCKSATEKLKMQDLTIAETKRVHIKKILEQIKKNRKWTEKAYNKHLGYLQGILSELIQWDIIEHNPAHNIKPYRVAKTIANRPPTSEELEIIKAYVPKVDANFWDIPELIYHTGIRPEETTKLQVKMIDRESRIINMPARITKDKEDRIVVINEPLWKILEPRLDFPGDYYLFGTFAPPKGYKRNFTYFIPGPNKLRKDTPTKRWHTLVKTDLGINVNLYSFKKLGANAKIEAGMSVRTLKEIYGHSSEVTTEIYITNLHQVMRKEIMEKSPEL